MIRYLKQAAVAAAAMAALSGCAGFDEAMNELYEGAMAYEQQEAQRRAQEQAFWNNYRTPVGSTTGRTNGTATSNVRTNATGQCTSGVMTTCVFPGGGTGPCCAAAQ